MLDIILVSFTSVICLALLVLFFYSYGPKMQCNPNSMYEYAVIFFSYVPFLNGVSLISYEISKFIIKDEDSVYQESSALLIVQYCLYTTTLVLSFFVNPLLIEFEKQPATKTVGERLKKAFCKTMILYIVIAVLAAIAIIIFVALKIPLNIGLIIGIVPSIMNLYGLIAFAISAGIGFVKAPITFWRNARPVHMLREYLCELSEVAEEIEKQEQKAREKREKKEKSEKKENKFKQFFKFGKSASSHEKFDNLEDSDLSTIEPESEINSSSEAINDTDFLVSQIQVQFEKVVRLQLYRDKKMIILKYLSYGTSILIGLLALAFLIFEFSFSITGKQNHSILRMILVKIKIDELNQLFLFIFIGLLAILSAYVFMCIKTEAVLPKPIIFLITKVFRVIPYKFVGYGRTPIRTFNKWSTYLQRLIPAIAFHVQKMAGVERSSLQTIMGKFDQFLVFWTVIRISTSALIIIVIIIYIILNWDDLLEEGKIQKGLDIYKKKVTLTENERNLEFYIITDEINSNIISIRERLLNDKPDMTSNLKESNSLFSMSEANDNIQVIKL